MRSTAKFAIGLALCLAASQLAAAEIDYLEDFALAKDRTVALQQLIPGTEEFYYYHCLHYQNTAQFAKVDELLKAWIERHKDTPRIREIQNRQALLTYSQNPEKSLDFIRRRLGLQFDQQRERLDEKPNLPTKLDPKLISRQTLLERAFALQPNLQNCEDPALDWLVGTELNPSRRRHLLERLQRPDYPQLAKLVVEDLKSANSGGFGSFKIHGQLLLTQLDECLTLLPELRNQQNFVNVYLSKLQPNADVDWQHDVAEQRAYLDRLWAFVQQLAPVHNSLKAHVLYQRLALERSQGLFDKPTFLRYLQLPRNAAYMNVAYMRLDENRQHTADLAADFAGVTHLPPVGTDEPLVRSYLQHFFLTETTYQPYATYVQDQYLKRVFAETKIVHGLGEAEQWYSLLAPAEYQALKERIDIEFAETNRQRFAADEAVRLDLDIKNVRTLIVKVYEINTRNFYRQNLAEVNTDLNLDGLVANQETTHEYPEPPLRRVRRHFEFPELTKPGVYVIDFIGNGQSSRAVVRKGQLRHLVRTSTAGHIFTVLDEQNRKLPQATLWFGGREYAPNAVGKDVRNPLPKGPAGDSAQAVPDAVTGEIVVPFTSTPRRQAIVLQQGDFCTLDYFQHQAESYSFVAGIYVDRESLLRRRKATVVVRPQLYLNGIPVTLSVLEDVRLVISSTDHEGVSAAKEVPDFKLFEDRDTTYEFQVPPRLSQIRFELKAKVQNLSQSKKLDLAATASFSVNQIDQTEKVECLHLTYIDGAYALDLLGKTGEVKADRPVRLALQHRDFREAAQVTLQTDAGGRVSLGPLPEIVSVTAWGPSGQAQSWTLQRDQCAYRKTLHGVVGQPLEVPYLGPAQQPARAEFSLLELRGQTYVADRFDALTIDGGLLRIAGLPRGDYDLWLKSENQHLRIRVAAGEKRDGYVLGPNRQLELRGERPLQIAAVTAAPETVTVRLLNNSKFARVHVFATRHYPAYSAYDHLSRVRDAEPFWRESQKLESLYVAGRNIGDEYRYILDRKYAKKYPGNMLERPSLLLNPWSVSSTETGELEAAGGAGFGGLKSAGGGKAGRDGAKDKAAGDGGEFANLDFLAQASLVLTNLIADEQGLISIPRANLGSHSHLHIVAVDPVSTIYRAVSLPETKVTHVDLRLTNGLDPKLHFAQQKQISVVDSRQPFTVADITTARIETYDSLAKVYALYVTLSQNPTLVEFGFLMNWPTLKPDEKRAQYSKYACHELHFFLYHKDPEFFRTVVQPYLKNKRDRQFLDRWLLGEDLTAYQQPWNYAHLNTAERILLAQRIAADRPHTVRDVSDRWSLIPPDVGRFRLLFETALKGSALETSDTLGLREAEKQVTSMMLGLQVQKLAELDVNVKNQTDEKAPATPQLDDLTLGVDKSAAESGKQLRARRVPKESLGKAKKEGGANGREGAGEALGEQLFFDSNSEGREATRRFYRQLDKTQEWAENNYYHVPIGEQNAELIAVNDFWRDYAQFTPGPTQKFRSTQFTQATKNFSEMVFALAVLDLPFQPEKHDTAYAAAQLTLTPGSPLVVFHEELKQVTPAPQPTPILVSQTFFRHSETPKKSPDPFSAIKAVTEEFLVHVVYGCQIVVTNPTSAKQKLDVLLQVPRGAIPVLKSRETQSLHVDLEPYRTQTLEYHFYFPAAGEFIHYPVHVAKDEHLVAQAAPFTFKVVEKLSRVDRTSWDYLSQFGTDADVLKYLEEANLHRTNLDKIAFRLRDKAFFTTVTGLLARRHAYNDSLWSFALKHNEPAVVREYLQHAEGWVGQCGAYLESPLLDIDPVVRQTYQHLDYRPLVNARAHQLGTRRQILNDRFHSQYHELLKILSCRRDLNDSELLAVTYYLLLQDRVEEALAAFGRVQAERLSTRLQYDYLAAYLALYREQPQQARTIAQKYATHPVDRWRELFAALTAQLDELAGQATKVVGQDNRNEVQTKLAATESSFEFQVEAKRVALNYQNLKQVRVNYYLMDIELLFSRNPFVQQYSGQFAFIRPNLTQTVDLPAQQTSTAWELPKQLHSSNVLVEIVGGGQTKSQAYYANSLAVQLLENYGQLQVKHSATGQPLAKVYVKVYAQLQDGTIKFYKDGYTDLRGRFDYASLSTDELDDAKKFALLVLSDEHGAAVREATPPQR